MVFAHPDHGVDDLVDFSRHGLSMPPRFSILLMKRKIKHHDFLPGELTTTRIKMRQIDGGLP
jgi:hypothetical protein